MDGQPPRGAVRSFAVALKVNERERNTPERQNRTILTCDLNCCFKVSVDVEQH